MVAEEGDKTVVVLDRVGTEGGVMLSDTLRWCGQRGGMGSNGT